MKSRANRKITPREKAATEMMARERSKIRKRRLPRRERTKQRSFKDGMKCAAASAPSAGDEFLPALVTGPVRRGFARGALLPSRESDLSSGS
jgi:hypothetical protein